MKGYSFAAAGAGLAGLLFGFDTVVVSGVTGALRSNYALSASMLGFTVAIALWGTLAGAIAGAFVGQRFGSRKGLLLAALCYLFSAAGSALAPNWSMLIVSRLVGGLAIGLSSVLAPVYLAEIAPADRRGATVGLFQVNIVLGIVLAYVCNALIGHVAADEIAWRWKLGIVAAPAALFFVMMRAVPESPRWLLLHGHSARARAAFRKLNGRELPPDIEQNNLVDDEARPRWSDLVRFAPRATALAVTIAALNQLTGINAILYYLNDIFAAAGFGRLSSDLQSIAIGSTNLFFTLLAMTMIDRWGRRRLLLIGSTGMAAALGAAGLVMSGRLPQSWLLAILVMFIASFAFSQGAVIWVYISELFPNRLRALGQGVGSGTIWLFDALVAQFYPVIAAYSRALPFVIFMFIMIAQLVLVGLFFPETKGLSLEEVARRLTAKNARALQRKALP